MADLADYSAKVSEMQCLSHEGEVDRMSGSVVEARGPSVGVGQLCDIYAESEAGRETIKAEVVGFEGETIILMPLEKLNGVQPGDTVRAADHSLQVRVGEKLLGRVLDGLGRPMDGGDRVVCPHSLPIYNDAPHPLERSRIEEPFHTGVRAIDLPVTLGKGQRVGIFAGPGLGKSTLLAQMARGSRADVNVIALIGERGREVKAFIDDCLGSKGLKKSVVVVATADVPPLLKVKAAFTSTAIAEYFRDRGMHVLYLMDSLTRVADSQREVGLAGGEPPTTRGYPPSVFSLIPSLTERLGCGAEGTITGLYAVLVEQDELNDPLAEAVRASLDGHIVLSRSLAERGHYPAIDVLKSVSRTFPAVTDPRHREVVKELKAVLSTYREAEELIKMGAYNRGSDPETDRALDLMPEINDYLQQDMNETASYQEARHELESIISREETENMEEARGALR